MYWVMFKSKDENNNFVSTCPCVRVGGGTDGEGGGADKG